MIQIRRCEQYTVTTVTKVAKLDPEKFRNLSQPYEGETDEDFMEYISELGYDLVDMTYEELDLETSNEIDKMFDNADWTEIHNTAWDGSNDWYEVGEENEEYRKTGGFKVNFDTYKSGW